ncbi:MAG TPA: cytochrome c oxidase assembly protein [Candidatus Limnocylindrales bacterium]|jgi:putative copper resistance protein D|nr:cytochrome c oxidase assembly protein [Candidatus Limnocylindrales bacterium]
MGRLGNLAAPAAAVLTLAAAAPVRAHGTVDVGPPTVAALLFGWTFEPIVAMPLLGAGLAWIAAVRAVNAAHPANPVPPVRTAAFLGGLVAIAVALMSGIERYDTVLFSAHMVQHILLTLVAPPLIALGAPITLLLRVARPDERRRLILPVLHSRIVRALSFPVVAWVLFAGVMWATHFSPVFDQALEDPFVHDLEHAAYLGAGLLFWWPAIGLDPTPWRMSHPVRALYVFLQMPQNTFLAVAILSASAPLYPHYATLVRTWGPTPLADQQAAAGIMWFVGDLLFLAAILGLVAVWMRHEERTTAIADRRADAQRAELTAREARLADRLAEERGSRDGA